jgi:ABC-2 type transport system permease protein
MSRHRHHHSNRTVNPYRGFIGVALREWRRLCADGPQKILLFAITPGVLWLFCAFLGNGSVADLPVAVCDEDQSVLSRTVARSFDATKLVRVVSYVNSCDEIRRGIAAGTFAGGLYLPRGMEAAVKAGRPVQPVFFRNGTNYLVSSFLSRDAQAVLRTVNAGLVKARLSKAGLGREQAMALIAPVGADVSNLYNVNFNYLTFLAPGIVFAQFGLIVMLAGAICFARERERHTLFPLRQRANASVAAALHGKTAPYAAVFAFTAALLLAVLFPLHHVASFTDAIPALPAIVLFVASSWWIGAAVGCVTGNAMIAAQVAIFVGMPSFIFSGWTFPLPAAPGVMAALAQLLPFTHFMPVWFSSARMNLGPLSSAGELAALGGIALAAYCLSHGILACIWKKTFDRRRAPSVANPDHPEREGAAANA